MNFKIPYVLGGFKNAALSKMNQQFVPLTRATNFFDGTTLSTFGNIYFDVVNAMAEEDKEYLSAVMEPRLYNYYLDSLEEMKNKDISLHTNDILNEVDEAEPMGPNKTSMFSTNFNDLKRNLGLNIYENKSKTISLSMEARGVYGKEIIRSKNADERYKFRFFNSLNEFWWKTSNPFECFSKKILVLNLVYKTNKKLIAKDSEDNVLIGSDGDSEEIHIWRFESNPDEIDWVLTDIDYCLEGNPYEYLEYEE